MTTPFESILSFVLVSTFVVGQGPSSGGGAPSDEQMRKRLRGPDLVLQHHVHGFVYCPNGEVSKVELLLRVGDPNRLFSAITKTVEGDGTGYFDLGGVTPGRYQLVVKNSCAGAVSAIANFDVGVVSEPTVFRDCVLEEVVVQLRRGEDPIVFHRPTKNVACG
jgi:hypothetical protein